MRVPIEVDADELIRAIATAVARMQFVRIGDMDRIAYTDKELAPLFGVTRSAVAGWRAKKLPPFDNATRIGGQWYHQRSYIEWRLASGEFLDFLAESWGRNHDAPRRDTSPLRRPAK